MPTTWQCVYASCSSPRDGRASRAGCKPGVACGYTIGNLATGTYHVFFSPLGEPWEAWYDGWSDAGAADPVAVVGGATTAGIDGRLGPASTPDPVPVPGAAPRHLDHFAGLLVVSRAGVTHVPMRCATACSGTASLSVGRPAPTRTRAARRMTIGTARFGLSRRLRGSVALRLSATGRALLRRDLGHLTAALSVTISDQTGASTEAVTARLRSAR